MAEDDPTDAPEPVDVRAIRERIGLDQEAFAKRYGLPYPGFGEHQELLTPDMRTYFYFIAKFPEEIAKEVKVAESEGWKPPTRPLH